MFDYFTNCSSNRHQVCCEDNPAKGPYDHFQSDDLDHHSRSHVRLKLDYFLTCNISDNIKLLHLNLVYQYMAYRLMLVSMILTLMQGHSGSPKGKNQC